MHRSLEHIVETHSLAAERRAQGKPIWGMEIKIKHLLSGDSTEETAAKVANEIASIIRASVPAEWLDMQHENWDKTLDKIVAGLEALRPDSYANDPSFSALKDLNNMLERLYDWADIKLVWIG